jgi:metal-responsive CopG/Arc/MetJ family transcriptional regulator
MAKIKINATLFQRMKDVIKAAGYSSIEEFVTHVIEKEVIRYEEKETDEKVADKLRGLGYIE